MNGQIFIACYLAAFIIMSLCALNRHARMIRTLRCIGLSDAELDAFKNEMLPNIILMMILCIVFTGSLVGGAILGVMDIID